MRERDINLNNGAHGKKLHCVKTQENIGLMCVLQGFARFPSNQGKLSDSSGLRVGIGQRKNSESGIQQARPRISVSDWLKFVTESKLPVFQT